MPRPSHPPQWTDATRQRAAVILFESGRLAVIARELSEETGLTARFELEVAVVFREGNREHYFRADHIGPGLPRAGLDLEPDSCPQWIPLAELPGVPIWPKWLSWRIAAWARDGWPVSPVRLSDSIEDLCAPCDS